VTTVVKTVQFIQSAHANQYWGDQEYWTHPVAVAETGSSIFEEAFDEDAVLAALLHDVVEDTQYTLEDLAEMGYSENVIEAVGLLTKDSSLDYAGNIQRIIQSGSRTAMMVKLADNTVNSTGDMSHMTEEKRVKLSTKYAASIAALTEALE
jgi:(p)ppGpp synthase/HD superfamily hydrolase